MKITIITGSRADYGLLQWPLKLLREDPFFEVAECKIWGASHADASHVVTQYLKESRPDLVMLLGDRYEVLGAAVACHLERVPIAHLCGGDVTEGAYDDAMRDCISRVSSLHFVTSEAALARLTQMGCTNVYLVGSTGIDYIKNADWKRPPGLQPYVVVAYYPETIDGTVDLEAVKRAIDGRRAVWVTSNPDRGAELIPGGTYSHDEFLNLIWHCEEFIGNSSALIYEAPELCVKTRMIGKRQRGRTIPWGDGHASERIVKILKYTAL